MRKVIEYGKTPWECEEDAGVPTPLVTLLKRGALGVNEASAQVGELRRLLASAVMDEVLAGNEQIANAHCEGLTQRIGAVEREAGNAHRAIAALVRAMCELDRDVAALDEKYPAAPAEPLATEDPKDGTGSG